MIPRTCILVCSFLKYLIIFYWTALGHARPWSLMFFPPLGFKIICCFRSFSNTSVLSNNYNFISILFVWLSKMVTLLPKLFFNFAPNSLLFSNRLATWVIDFKKCKKKKNSNKSNFFATKWIDCQADRCILTDFSNDF